MVMTSSIAVDRFSSTAVELELPMLTSSVVNHPTDPTMEPLRWQLLLALHPVREPSGSPKLFKFEDDADAIIRG